MSGLIADFMYRYSLLDNLEIDFNYVYNLTSDLYKDFNYIYDITNTVTTEKDFKYIYSLYEQASESINNSFTATIGTDSIRFIQLSVSCDEDSYCFSFSGSVASKTDWDLCVPDSAITIVINSTKTIELVIDERARQRSLEKTKYTVKGRSNTSRLDFPHAEAITEDYSATTALTIVKAMADIESITLDFDIYDWAIPKDTFSVDEQSPLAIIKTLATAAGAVTQTKENGDLWIRYKYPYSPTTFGDVTQDITITDVDDIFSLSESFDLKKGYNKVLLSDKELSSQDEGLIAIELDSKRNGNKVVFGSNENVYIRVFHDRDYTGLITSGSAQLIKEDEIFEAEPEDIDFIREIKPTTSRYIHNIISFTWYGNNLGAVVKSDANQVQATGAGENTLGTGRLRYNSKADIWLIDSPASQPTIFKMLVLKGFEDD